MTRSVGFFFFLELHLIFLEIFINGHIANVEYKYLRYRFMRTSCFQSLVYSPGRMYSNPFQTLPCMPLKGSPSKKHQGKRKADCHPRAWQTDIAHTSCQHSFGNRCSYRGMVDMSPLTFVE